MRFPRSFSQSLEAGTPTRIFIGGYKRIKEGKLSIFLFHVTHRKTTLFGKNRILRDNPYGYIPASEARAWRRELEERAVKQGVITEEELEGAKPDWHGEFLQWRNRRERMGFFGAMEHDFGLSRGKALALLAKMIWSKKEEISVSEKRSRRHGRGK